MRIYIVDLYRVLNDYKPNDSVKVEVIRNGNPVRVSVQLEPKPQQYNQ
jgi:S1-C subfamily serine protease